MSNITTSVNREIISTEKYNLVRDQICRGASPAELELFITNCNRTGLDPFQKQCWAVKRWDASLGREVMAFQTGVDGFRVIANRSEKYAGQLGPYWCGDDGDWKDVWLSSNSPVAAKVGILRSDFKEPLWAVARFSSYAAKKKDGSLTTFWVKMPDLMLAKVAECLALRKAFPQDLSGIYAQEEMQQADDKPVTQVEIEKPIEAKQIMQPEPPKEIIVEEVPEQLFTKEEVADINKKITSPRIPNEAKGLSILVGGKYNGKQLKEINKKELYKYIVDCEKYAKDNQKPLPAEIRTNIENVKDFLGLF